MRYGRRDAKEEIEHGTEGAVRRAKETSQNFWKATSGFRLKQFGGHVTDWFAKVVRSRNRPLSDLRKRNGREEGLEEASLRSYGEIFAGRLSVILLDAGYDSGMS